MKQKRNYLSYSFYCNSEDYEVISKLQKEHSINISNAVRIFLRNKLEQLEQLEKENKKNNIL